MDANAGFNHTVKIITYIGIGKCIRTVRKLGRFKSIGTSIETGVKHVHIKSGD